MNKKNRLTKLNQYLDELNSTDMGFNFKLKVSETDKDLYYLYDANECYHFDYAYNSYIMMRDCAKEFGFEEPTEYCDTIHDKLTELVGDVVEWYDNVTMMFRME